MSDAARITRSTICLRLARTFALAWAIVAAIFVIPVLNGAIAWRDWPRGMVATVISPFVAIPLLFAVLSLRLPEEKFWLRAAQVVFGLWWLGAALVLGTGV